MEPEGGAAADAADVQRGRKSLKERNRLGATIKGLFSNIICFTYHWKPRRLIVLAARVSDMEPALDVASAALQREQSQSDAECGEYE